MNKRLLKMIMDPPINLSKIELKKLKLRMIDVHKKMVAKAKQVDSGKYTKQDRTELFKLALKDRDVMLEYMLSGGSK